MRKIVLLSIITLGLYSAFGQGVGSDPEMPSMIPLSPNAYSLGKYGEIPVTESTGQINYTIPLYSYACGDISIPISMNYSGNAVKVDQLPTLTGVNWTLFAGGIITRKTRDRADFSPLTIDARGIYTSDYLNSLNDVGDIYQGEWAETLDQMTNHYMDTEADIFNFNFGGYSGSFYLDTTGEAKLTKYDKELTIDHNLKLAGNDSEFIITTLDGVRYYFGGDESSEVTKSFLGHNKFIKETDYVQTAFYLYKIESPTGNIINLTYKRLANELKDIGRNLEISITKGYGCISTNYNSVENCGEIYRIDDRSSTGMTFYEDHGSLYIQKISSNNTEEFIEFKGTNDKLESIDLYTRQNNKFKSFNLLYYTPMVKPNEENERFFLTNVVEQDSSGNNSNGKKYSFEYNNLEAVPQRMSYAQDHWGYYNGANSNESLIPKWIDKDFDSRFKLILADREVHLNYTKVGSLLKIIYPTGGSTNFEYENGYFGTHFKRKEFSVFLDASANSQNNNIYYRYPSDNGVFITPKNDILLFEIETNGPFMRATPIVAKLKVKNLTLGNSVSYPFSIGELKPILGGGDITKNFTKEVPVDKLMEYVFEFEIDLEHFELPENAYVTADFRMNYLSEYPSEAPGLRIKRVVNKSSENDNSPTIKRYYYNTFENKENEYREMLFYPQYLTEGVLELTCKEGENGGNIYPTVNPLSKKTIRSSCINNLFFDDSQKQLYPFVTISYGGDNFELGGVEKHFVIEKNTLDIHYHSNYENASNLNNRSWNNGTLLKEIYYKNEDNLIVKSKEVEYFYNTKLKNDSIVNVMTQYDEFQNIGVYTLNTPYKLEKMNIGMYNTYTFWQSYDSIFTKEYLNNGVIESYTKYHYDSELAGLPSRVEQKDSEGNIRIVKKYYPTDVGLLAGLSSTERNHINELQDQNRKAELIQEESYISGEKKETKRVLYKDYGSNYTNTGDLILQNKIQTSIDVNPLEDRIIYNDYDSKGNLTEVSKADDLSVHYIWGYNETKPIAKIENFRSSNITPEIEQLIKNAKLASNNDIDKTTEYILINTLSELRNLLRDALPTCFVSSYTYDPLIGVTSQTDPRGRTTYYTYDSFGRLEKVLDHDYNVIKQYEYNYSSQTQ